jgi:hypothetical protein
LRKSISAHKETIFRPNSEFERRIIFQYYLDNNIQITEEEREILLECVAVEPENIGIIGCLLNDKTHLNTLRLAIASTNKSNKKLANLSKELLLNLDVNIADTYYFVERDYESLTKVEVDVTNVYLTFCY